MIEDRNRFNNLQDKYLKDYNEAGLEVASLISLKNYYKTMGMVMCEPFKKPAWNDRSYIYHVTIKIMIRYGKPCGSVVDVPIEVIKKFRPWPYFHKPKPEKNQKESVAKPEQDVVQ